MDVNVSMDRTENFPAFAAQYYHPGYLEGSQIFLQTYLNKVDEITANLDGLSNALKRKAAV